jgi:hypothetical protein
MSDKDIRRFRSGFLKTALLLMKHRRERAYLLKNLPEIFNFVENEHADDPDSADYYTSCRQVLCMTVSRKVTQRS